MNLTKSFRNLGHAEMKILLCLLPFSISSSMADAPLSAQSLSIEDVRLAMLEDCLSSLRSARAKM